MGRSAWTHAGDAVAVGVGAVVGDGEGRGVGEVAGVGEGFGVLGAA